MTTYLAAHKGVETEIIERIEALSLNEQTRYRFRRYSDAAAASRPIEQFTGTPRVFNLGPSSKLDNIATCGGHYRETRAIALQIVYPLDNFRGANWDAIRVDDINLIRADLLNHPTATAGVGYRIVQPTATIETTKYSDDPWHLAVVPIEIYFDVTTS